MPGGCRKEQTEDAVAKAEAVEPLPRHVLVFPKELEVEDESVNAFVREMMEVSTAGNYDDFRLLWSARQQPLPRSEFEKGWSAVEQIRVLALEKVALAGESAEGDADAETVYALYADVQLDAEQLGGMRAATNKEAGTRRKPILMFLREHGQWRIGRAPKQMCAWIKKKVDGDETGADSAPADAKAAHGDAPSGG